MPTDTMHDLNRIARALGYESFADAPRIVQNSIEASAEDGVAVLEDDEDWIEATLGGDA